MAFHSRAHVLALLIASSFGCSSAPAEVTQPVDDAATENGDDAAEPIDEGVDAEASDVAAEPDTRPVVDSGALDAAPPSPCSDLVLPPAIEGDRWGDKQPAAVGGALPTDGTWHLFSARRYGATSGKLGAFRGAFRVKDGKYDLRLLTAGGAIESSGSYSTSGTTLQLVPTCSIGELPTSLGYDVGLNYVRLHASPMIYSFAYPM